MPENPAAPPHYSSGGILLSEPLRLKILDPSDRNCSICHEPLSDRHSARTEREAETEWPSKVVMVAEYTGVRHLCGHVFGSRCLTNHINAPGPWRMNCPMCRQQWVQDPKEDLDHDTDRDNDAVGEVEAFLRAQGEAEVRIEVDAGTQLSQLSDRVATRTGAGVSGSASSSASRRERACRTRRFNQRMFELFEMEENKDSIKGTLEEVERKLEEEVYSKI